MKFLAFKTFFRKLRTLLSVRVPKILKNSCIEAFATLDYVCFYFLNQSAIRNLLSYSAEDKSDYFGDKACNVYEYLEFVTIAREDFSDLYQPYLGSLRKYLSSEFIHSVVTNASNGCVPCAYVLRRSFKLNLLRFLLNFSQRKYIILMHLDYFLVGPVDVSRLGLAIRVMEEDPAVDFIQFAKNVGERVANKKYNDDYNYLRSESELFFNMQVRIWRKRSLFKLISSHRSALIADERGRSRTCHLLGMNGLIDNSVHTVSRQFDQGNNQVVPYLATALCNKKWPLKYKTILMPIFDQYNINPLARGWIN